MTTMVYSTGDGYVPEKIGVTAYSVGELYSRPFEECNIPVDKVDRALEEAAKKRFKYYVPTSEGVKEFAEEDDVISYLESIDESPEGYMVFYGEKLRVGVTLVPAED